MKTLVFLIPRRKGKGFLKNPTGGHHVTETYRKLRDGLEGVANEVWDEFGMLHINIKHIKTTEGYETSLNKIRPFLKETFPQITEFKEVGWKTAFDLVG